MEHPSHQLQPPSPQGHSAAKAQPWLWHSTDPKGCVCWLRPYKSELHRASPISAPSPFRRTIWPVQEEWGAPSTGNAAPPGKWGRVLCWKLAEELGMAQAPWTQTVTGCSRTDVALTALWGLSTPGQLCLPLRALQLSPAHPPHQNLPLRLDFPGASSPSYTGTRLQQAGPPSQLSQPCTAGTSVSWRVPGCTFSSDSKTGEEKELV